MIIYLNYQVGGTVQLSSYQVIIFDVLHTIHYTLTGHPSDPGHGTKISCDTSTIQDEPVCKIYV